MQSDHGTPLAVLWLAACVIAPFHRAGFALLAALAWGGWAMADGTMESTHAVLIGWVALILAVNVEVPLLLRWQVTVLYLFAAVNKLNGDFLRGDAIAQRTTDLPLGVPIALAAAGTVLVEAGLALLVWRHSQWALPLAVLLHGSIVALMGTRLYEWVLLGSYNGLVVLLVWWVTRTGPCRPSPSPGTG